MPRIAVKVPGFDAPVYFPEGMSPEDINTAIQINVLKSRPKLFEPQTVPAGLKGPEAPDRSQMSWLDRIGEALGQTSGLPVPKPVAETKHEIYEGAVQDIGEGVKELALRALPATSESGMNPPRTRRATAPVDPSQYETKLSRETEKVFQAWKQVHAPDDSGEDYDWRGAFLAKESRDAKGHWTDRFKKPNHPTFSVESEYAHKRPDLAGTWTGKNHDQYVPPKGKAPLSTLGAMGKVVSGAGQIAAPAVLPMALISAPIATLLGLPLGLVGTELTVGLLTKMGWEDEEAKQFIGDIVGGYAGTKAFKAGGKLSGRLFGGKVPEPPIQGPATLDEAMMGKGAWGDNYLHKGKWTPVNPSPPIVIGPEYGPPERPFWVGHAPTRPNPSPPIDLRGKGPNGYDDRKPTAIGYGDPYPSPRRIAEQAARDAPVVWGKPPEDNSVVPIVGKQGQLLRPARSDPNATIDLRGISDERPSYNPRTGEITPYKPPPPPGISDAPPLLQGPMLGPVERPVNRGTARAAITPPVTGVSEAAARRADALDNVARQIFDEDYAAIKANPDRAEDALQIEKLVDEGQGFSVTPPATPPPAGPASITQPFIQRAGKTPGAGAVIPASGRHVPEGQVPLGEVQGPSMPPPAQPGTDYGLKVGEGAGVVGSGSARAAADTLLPASPNTTPAEAAASVLMPDQQHPNVQPPFGPEPRPVAPANAPFDAEVLARDQKAREDAMKRTLAEAGLPHAYDPPEAFPGRNAPCKICGKTARNGIHKGAPPPDVPPDVPPDTGSSGGPGTPPDVPPGTGGTGGAAPPVVLKGNFEIVDRSGKPNWLTFDTREEAEAHIAESGMTGLKVRPIQRELPDWATRGGQLAKQPAPAPAAPGTGLGTPLEKAAATVLDPREIAAKRSQRLDDIAQYVYGKNFASLKKGQRATATGMLDRGEAGDIPVYHELPGGMGMDFGLSSVLGRKEGPGRWINFKKFGLSGAEEEALTARVLQVGDELGLNPFKPEPMDVVAQYAKQMGLPEAQATADGLKALGIKNRASVAALASHIKDRTQLIVKLNQQLNQGGLSRNTQEVLSNQMEMASSDLNKLLRSYMGTKTEFGRNLNSLKAEVDANWDMSYWLGRATRAKGGHLDNPTAAKIEKIINDGNAATEAGDEAGAAAAKKKLVTLIGDAQQNGFGSTVMTLIRAGYLSAPSTHLANIYGNALFQGGMELPAKLMATIPDFIMSLAHGDKHRTVAGPSPVKAIATSVKNLGNKTRYAGMTGDQEKHMKIAEASGAFDKAVNKYVKPVFWMLEKEDEGFKRTAFDESIIEQAKLLVGNAKRAAKASGKPLPSDAPTVEGLIANPSEEMTLQAIYDAKFATFNNPNWVSEGVKGLKARARASTKNAKSDLADVGVELGLFVADSTVPFVRTPTNVTARALDYSIGAPAKFLGELGTTAWDARKLAKGQAATADSPAIAGMKLGQAVSQALTPQRQRAVSMAFGRGATGLGWMAFGYYMAQEGKATGLVKDKPDTRGREELRGASPGSVRIFGKWRNMNRMGAPGMLTMLGAAKYEQQVRDLGSEEAARKPDEILKMLATAPTTKLHQTILNLGLPIVSETPMLRGVSDMQKTLAAAGKEGQEWTTNRAVANRAASLLPVPGYTGLVSELAAMTDKTVRQGNADAPLQAVVNTVGAKAPGLRQYLDLPSMSDPFGVTRPTTPVDPFRSTPDRTDPVIAEMTRLKVGGSKIGFLGRETLEHLEDRMADDDLPPRFRGETNEQFEERAAAEGYRRIETTHDEHVRIEQITGHEVGKALKELMASEDWQQYNDPEKRDEIRAAEREVRSEFNEYITGDKYQGMNKEQRIKALDNILKNMGLKK